MSRQLVQNNDPPEMFVRLFYNSLERDLTAAQRSILDRRLQSTSDAPLKLRWTAHASKDPMWIDRKTRTIVVCSSVGLDQGKIARALLNLVLKEQHTPLQSPRKKSSRRGAGASSSSSSSSTGSRKQKRRPLPSVPKSPRSRPGPQATPNSVPPSFARSQPPPCRSQPPGRPAQPPGRAQHPGRSQPPGRALPSAVRTPPSTPVARQFPPHAVRRGPSPPGAGRQLSQPPRRGPPLPAARQFVPQQPRHRGPPPQAPSRLMNRGPPRVPPAGPPKPTKSEVIDLVQHARAALAATAATKSLEEEALAALIDDEDEIVAVGEPASPPVGPPIRRSGPPFTSLPTPVPNRRLSVAPELERIVGARQQPSKKPISPETTSKELVHSSSKKDSKRKTLRKGKSSRHRQQQEQQQQQQEDIEQRTALLEKTSRARAELEKKRNQIINGLADFQRPVMELLFTESDFAQYLRDSLCHLIQPARDRGLLTQQQADLLFPEYEALLEISQELVNNMEQAGSAVYDLVGQIYDAGLTEQALRLFAYAIARQQKGNEFVVRLAQSSDQFAAFVTMVSKTPQLGGLDLSSLMIKVFQRVTKLPLLLKAILKVRPRARLHPDTPCLDRALMKTEKLLKQVNEAQRIAEAVRKSDSLQARVGGIEKMGAVPSDKHAALGRRLIFEGSVPLVLLNEHAAAAKGNSGRRSSSSNRLHRKGSGNTNSEQSKIKIKPAHVALFSDCFLVSSSTGKLEKLMGEKSMKFAAHIELASASVTDCRSSAHRHAFEISEGDASVLVACESLECKLQWIFEIESAISDFHGATMTSFDLKKMIVNLQNMEI